MSKLRGGLFYLVVHLSLVCTAEDYSWWNEIHHWDGYTSWVQYLTISTSYMGPNALPVPDIKNGTLGKEMEVELLAGTHWSPGDNTKDFFSRVYIPFANKKVALEGYVVPIEFFSTDTATRDERGARGKSGEGYAGGDIYFSTQVQLIQDQEKCPDILLELAFRTASGTNLSNARFTDGSGYFFDLSIGKTYKVGESNDISIRPFVMAGFYSYQTYDIQHPQNDAPLFGLGANLEKGKFIFSTQLGGYSGYLNIGDKPLVYRASLRFKQTHWDWKISYELGLNDFAFQTIRVGVIYHLDIGK